MNGILAAYFQQPALISGVAAVALLLGVLTAGLWAFGVLRWAGRPHRSRHLLPSVSVIVVARNEEEHIARCLRSLLELDYPRERIEICMVDDHSTDRTAQIAQRIADETGGRLLLLSAPENKVNEGPKKAALRKAIAHTKGELLLFTDADCVVDTGWARAIVECYEEQTGAVTGAVLPEQKTNWNQKLIWLERLIISYSTASAIGIGKPASASGGNFSCRREAFAQLGGFAHSELPSGDDDLLAQAITKKGWKVEFARGAASVVREIRPPDVRRAIGSAIRHQSTVPYYPIGWRIVYALTILSGISFTGLLITGLFRPDLLILVGGSFALRAAIEGPAVCVFARQLGVRLSIRELLMVEVLLPFYLILRPLLALCPRYSWRGRTHTKARWAAAQSQ